MSESECTNFLNEEEVAAIDILEKFSCPSSSSHSDTSVELSSSHERIGEQVFAHIYNLCPLIIRNLILDKLKLVINSTLKSDDPIDKFYLDKLMKRFFNVKLFQSKGEKKFLLAVEAILKSAIVYYLYLANPHRPDLFTSPSELIEEYPEFAASDVDSVELKFLLIYRNMMKVALQVITPQRNKRLLMDICSTLEGSGKVYITGGTQSASTCRRVSIYEREADVQRTRRPKRQVSRKVPQKTTTICECGSEILIRTTWRHNSSKRHISYLQSKILETERNLLRPHSMPMMAQVCADSAIDYDEDEAVEAEGEEEDDDDDEGDETIDEEMSP